MNSDSNLPSNPQSDLQPNLRATTQAHPEDEIVRATSFGRGIAATTIIAVIVVAACIAGWMLTKSNLHLAMGMSPSPKAIASIQYGFCTLAFLVAALSALLTVTGFRVVRQRRSPLAGAVVWRDTPIIRGDRARTIGLAYMVAGIVSFIVGIALTIYIWDVLQKVADASIITLRPGVTILQQPTVVPR